MSWQDILMEDKIDCCDSAMKLYVKNESKITIDNEGIKPVEEVMAMDCSQFHDYLEEMSKTNHIIRAIRNHKKRCDENRLLFTPGGGKPMGQDDFMSTDPIEEGQRKFRRNFR